MRVRDIILPEDRVFLDLFDKMAKKIAEAANLLVEQCVNLSSTSSICFRIRQLEHECDDIVRSIYGRLEESLITPLEPEEIARLAKALDDVIDTIDWVSHQICNYHIKVETQSLKEFTEFIALCSVEIQKGVSGVHEFEQRKEVRMSIESINRIWNESSDLLSRSVSELFDTNDTLMILKLKDIVVTGVEFPNSAGIFFPRSLKSISGNCNLTIRS